VHYYLTFHFGINSYGYSVDDLKYPASIENSQTNFYLHAKAPKLSRENWLIIISPKYFA